MDETGNDGGLDLNSIEQNEYYSNERLESIIGQNLDNDFTIFSLNIGSLPLHINDLSTTLSLLKLQPDIIGLSETKITTEVNSYYNPSLENYKFHQSKSSTVSGSVGVFIKKSLVTEIRD